MRGHFSFRDPNSSEMCGDTGQMVTHEQVKSNLAVLDATIG